MLKDRVLTLLKEAEGPLSGESMSKTLAVSRTAIWKAVDALREEGYTVEALPAKGYRLTEAPDLLSAGELDRPGREVIYLPQVDSTNDECRRRAADGAEGGLIVIAGEQTRGKGRRGRSFQSLAGKGLYLSLMLRPDVALSEISQLTAWAAVAVCRAIDRLTGLVCGIKWTNDIIVNGKKLCGILTELGVEGETGALDYVVLGMGVNVGQTKEDFGELSDIAISLAQCLKNPPRRAELAAALLDELDRLTDAFPAEKTEYLEEYRRRCVTLNRDVRLIRPQGETPAFALAVNDDFSLRVRLADGSKQDVSSGEVSVRAFPLS